MQWYTILSNLLNLSFANFTGVRVHTNQRHHHHLFPFHTALSVCSLPYKTFFHFNTFNSVLCYQPVLFVCLWVTGYLNWTHVGSAVDLQLEATVTSLSETINFCRLFNHTATLQDPLNKVNFEPVASSSELTIEKAGMWVERTHQKKEART